MSTYTPKVGDTVRWGASTQTFTVRTDIFNYHVAATEDDSEATMHLFHVDDLVKVEPIPADRYAVMVGIDCTSWWVDYPTRDEAQAYVDGLSGSRRVARFAFAEWVVPGE